MSTTNRWFVAILPGQWCEERAERLAAALGHTLFDANQLLRHALPFVVELDDGEHAHQFARRLSEAGVAARSFDGAALARVAAPPVAGSVVLLDARSDGAGGGGPFRQAPPALELRFPDGRSEQLPASAFELALVALQVHHSESGLDEFVVDLHGTDHAVRLVERVTSLAGFGHRRYEQRASYLALRDWLRLQRGRPRLWEGQGSPDWEEWSKLAWLICQSL